MSSTDSFREKLDKEYEWPALYTFKFIAPISMVDKIREIFTNHEIKEKESSKGNYRSITVSVMARSSEQVTDYYIKVHQLGEGIIAL